MALTGVLAGFNEQRGADANYLRLLDSVRSSQFNDQLAQQRQIEAQNEFAQNLANNQSQFGANLGQRQSEFGQDFGLRQSQADRNYGLQASQFNLEARAKEPQIQAANLDLQDKQLLHALGPQAFDPNTGDIDFGKLSQAYLQTGNVDGAVKAKQLGDMQNARNIIRNRMAGTDQPQSQQYAPQQPQSAPQAPQSFDSAQSLSGSVSPNGLVAQPQSFTTPSAPQPNSKLATSQKYLAVADQLSSAGLGDQAKAYYDLAEKYRPEVKEQKLVVINGERKLLNVYKDGTSEVQPYAPESDVSKTFNSDIGKGAAEYKTTLDNKVAAGSDLMLRIEESRKALEDFRAGGGTEARAKLAQIAQSVPGVPAALVNGIAGGDLSAMQEFQKLAVQQATEQLKQSLGGQGRIAQAEFKVFQANNPNLNTDPNAIEKVFNFATKVYQRDRTEQQAFSDYRAKGGDPAEWASVWPTISHQQGFLNPQQVTGQAQGARPSGDGGWSIQRVD